jgi:hypothetical protein
MRHVQVDPKRALVALVGLMLIASASACGTSKNGSRLYDAKATYKCLTARPDYLLTRRYAESNGRAPDPPRLGYDVSGTPQKKPYEAYYTFKVGPVSSFDMEMYANDLQSASLLFFDKPGQAALLERLLLAEYRSLVEKYGPQQAKPAPQYALKRNIFIDTTPTPFAKTGPVRSIILGCLRSR